MKEVKVTLVKDWMVKPGVRLPDGVEIYVDPMIEAQLEKADVVENRERKVKSKSKK